MNKHQLIVWLKNYFVYCQILLTLIYIFSAYYPSSFSPSVFPSGSCHVLLKQLRISNNNKFKLQKPNVDLTTNASESDSLCSLTPNVTWSTKNILKKPPPTFEDIEFILRQNQDVEFLHGAWKFQNCQPSQRLAVIVPFRKRWPHLRYLLKVLHLVLQSQKQFYQIFVVEQYGNLTFNKALLMNIAFRESLMTLKNFTHFVFHDVDLIPESNDIIYTAGDNPRHLSVAINEMRYLLPYFTLVGGVIVFKTQQFIDINGFSNLYWGWGGEDDDLGFRILSSGYKIERPDYSSQFQMIRHVKRHSSNSRLSLLFSWQRWPKDGLNSLKSHLFKILHVKTNYLYTHILIDVGQPPTDSDKNLNDILKFYSFVNPNKVTSC